MTGTPWSAPPFTLNPNLPWASGRMVTVTMPVLEPLEPPLTSLRASSGRGEEAGGGLLSSLTLMGSGERGRRRAVEAWLKAWLAWLTGGSLDARPTTSLLRSELESSTKENFADGAERSTGEARPCVEGEDEEGGGREGSPGGREGA